MGSKSENFKRLLLAHFISEVFGILTSVNTFGAKIINLGTGWYGNQNLPFDEKIVYAKSKAQPSHSKWPPAENKRECMNRESCA